MTGLTDTASRAALNALVAAYPYVALFTSVGADTGTGFTEVTAAGYARFNSTGLWNSAAGSAPASVTNSADFPFGPAGTDWGTVVAVGLFTLASAGVLGAWDYLGAFPWLPATVAAGSPGAITTDHAHGLSVGNACAYSTEYGGSAPSFSQGTLSGPLAVAHVATTVFDVTNGGLPVNTTASGTGSIRRIAASPILTGGSLTIGSLTITLA